MQLAQFAKDNGISPRLFAREYLKAVKANPSASKSETAIRVMCDLKQRGTFAA